MELLAEAVRTSASLGNIGAELVALSARTSDPATLKILMRAQREIVDTTEEMRQTILKVTEILGVSHHGR